jgi:hypothetical protein
MSRSSVEKRGKASEIRFGNGASNGIMLY